MIICNNIQKGYDTNGTYNAIYDNFNREVQSGTSIAIMGPSGSGKSTLLHMLSGLIQPDQGEMVINGTKISDFHSDEATAWRAKNIAFIFQQFHLIPNLTVQDNIDLVIDIAKITRRFDTKEILELVGLAGYEDRYPYQLSGGEQQRVAIARAFVGNLPILLADEPTGNLDHINSVKIMDLMMSMQKMAKITAIIITHDPFVASYADLSYQLVNGTLEQIHNIS